jgi:hypothetical protein
MVASTQSKMGGCAVGLFLLFYQYRNLWREIMYIPNWCRPIIIIPFIAWAIVAMMFWSVTAYAADLDPKETTWRIGDQAVAVAGCYKQKDVQFIAHANVENARHYKKLMELFDGTGNICWQYGGPTPVALVARVYAYTKQDIPVSIWRAYASVYGTENVEIIYLTILDQTGPHEGIPSKKPSSFQI